MNFGSVVLVLVKNEDSVIIKAVKGLDRVESGGVGLFLRILN